MVYFRPAAQQHGAYRSFFSVPDFDASLPILSVIDNPLQFVYYDFSIS
jgi:hypothetical protein